MMLADRAFEFDLGGRMEPEWKIQRWSGRVPSRATKFDASHKVTKRMKSEEVQMSADGGNARVLV